MPVSDADLTVWLNNLRAVIVAARKQTSAPKMSAALAPTLTTIDAELALVKPPVVAPAAPLIQSATQTAAGTVAVTWSPSPTALGYNVWRNGAQIAWPALTNIGAAPLKVNADGTLTYTDTGGLNEPGGGLALGAYSYQVGAYSTLVGPLSPAVGVTVAVPTVPPVTPPVPSALGPFKGVYAWDQTVATTKSYERSLSVPHFDLALVHGDLSSWGALISNWFIPGWRGQGYRMVITFCPFPADGVSNLAAAARGDYRAQWATMLASIAAAFPDAILRFAHEQNCCYPWKASNDLASYLAMWKIWAPMARQASSKFVLCWNPIIGNGTIAAEKTYPGRAYVDVAASDVYDMKGGYPSVIRSGPYGLDWLATFAKSEGLPTMLCEWGPANYPQLPAQNSGDDVGFVVGVWDWKQAVGASDIRYEDTNADVRSEDGDFPKCKAAYIARWGTKPSIAGRMARRVTSDLIVPSGDSHGARVGALMIAARNL